MPIKERTVSKRSSAKVSQKERVLSPAIKRFYTKAGRHPFDEVTWKEFPVSTRGTDGKTYERSVEFPDFWSEAAISIASSKYFRGRVGSSEWERSLKQVISRVVRVFRGWGLKFGHLKNETEANIFADELSYILLHQHAAFNSPVWFNVGIKEEPQCSACFILDIDDSMESILEWIHDEGIIFKGGSGAGINLSPLRSKMETLSPGGHSSGPVSFMRGADAVAGMIKSGGSTRRAAKMVVLDVSHPDVEDFISAKAEEEKKVHALIEAGYNMYDLNNPAWNSIQYQNANNSVRVTDEFMRTVESDGMFSTKFIRNGEVARTYRAKDLFYSIAEAAWKCGDPGLQYDTTINQWHTCPNTDRINASNPCSEYMFLDNSACNLASINLLKYLDEDNTFAVAGFRHTVQVITLAQEIIVSGSSYPTEKIAKNSEDYRPLGLGFANLGAMLMTLGFPYDSDEARHTAGAITALMTGEAYRVSSLVARRVGAFNGFEKNKPPFLRVMKMHQAALYNVYPAQVFDGKIYEAAEDVWNDVINYGSRFGFRNAQATVIAPTGTIALMMDCATTGIEPEFALVKIKQLVGGGTMRFVNSSVPQALKNLGYVDSEIENIKRFLEENGTIEGAPGLREEHLPVFDCAVKPANGKRSIHWQGHVKMVAAVQPFISGAISKTFNMTHEATISDIEKAYTMGWKMGLKAFAVYRDGSKAAQPLVTSSGLAGKSSRQKPIRQRLPVTRNSETHKFSIAGHEGYITYSAFEDGRLAEVFVKMAKQGSTLSGLLDSLAISTSIALQYGVPLKTLVRKFAYSRFEPAGYTENPDIQVATSIVDYLFRYLAIRFLSPQELIEFGISDPRQVGKEETVKVALPEKIFVSSKDNPRVDSSDIRGEVVYADTVCKECGGLLIQTGTCKTCIRCGSANGGC